MDMDHTEPVVVDTKTALDSWRYRHHFTHKTDQGKNSIVQCNLCLPKVNLLSTSKSSTSNLKKHLDRKHLGCEEARNHVPEKRGRKKEHNESNGTFGKDHHFHLKKPKMEVTCGRSPAESRLDELLFDFVVEDCRSLRLLDQPGFRKLLEAVTEAPLALDKPALSAKVDLAFSCMREVLVAALDRVRYVCTTADIWTTAAAAGVGRRYLAVTCHWIDGATLERRSAALEFARLRGAAAAEEVWRRIDATHRAFALEGKVRTVLVDNGSPLVHLFREFPAPGGDEEEDDEGGEVEEEEDDAGFFEDVGAILDVELQRTTTDMAPDVRRCAAHTLEQIVTEDFRLAMSQDPACRRLHRSSMAKVAAFWRKCHRLQVASERAEELAALPLAVPCSARWSGEYRVAQRVALLGERERAVLAERLGVAAPLPEEMAFLREYLGVFRPLAFALELLGSERRCYLGLVLPTVLSLREKLMARRAASRFLADAIDALVGAFAARFGDNLASVEASMAAATTPQFRLWWTPSASEREQLRAMLLEEAANLDHPRLLPAKKEEEEVEDVVEADAVAESEDDFFGYGPATAAPLCQLERPDAAEEVRRYLEGTDKSLDCLKDFPRIRRLFVKYNTRLPAPVPVQRLFQHKANLSAPQGVSGLTDDFFEKVNLLRYNGAVTAGLTGV